MTAFYNENNKFAAKWLRNLIDAGQIAPGVVDERDIRDIEPHELSRYTQCHFFAGIGVWSYALRRAGWSDDRPVWTGSCPCQPFSTVGRRDGFADQRHLWPHWFHLIERAKPKAVPVFGEQVASKDGLAWIELVHADLEGTGYAVGAFDLCSAGFGGPHIRQRLYFVAHWLGDADDARLEGHTGDGDDAAGRPVEARSTTPPGGVNGFWADAEWRECSDGKLRPIEPGIEPLAASTPTTVGELQAYGNALTAEVAVNFISSYIDVVERKESNHETCTG